MTERLVTAMRQPWFKIWGHALGRYVLRRPPIECDLDAVLDAVAGLARGDRDQRRPAPARPRAALVREARLRGIRFVVSCDAHSTRVARATSASAWTWRGGPASPAPTCSTRWTPTLSGPRCGRLLRRHAILQSTSVQTSLAGRSLRENTMDCGPTS